MEEKEYWEKKNKREGNNVVIGIIIIIGAIILSAYIKNVIPAIIGIVLAAIIYQRDN